jgi:hypothetical protein
MLYYSEIDLKIFNNLIQELEQLDLTWFEPSNIYSSHQICLNSATGYTDDTSFGAGYFADKGNSDFFIRHTPKGVLY